MFQTNKTIYRILLFVNLACIAACLLLGFFNILDSTDDLWAQLANLVAMVALFYAAYYMLAGYSKKAAVHYKAFAGVFAASQVLAVVSSATAAELNVTTVVLQALLTVVVLVLLLGRNMGSMLSLGLCGFLMGMSVGLLMLLLANGMAGLACTTLLLAIEMTAMTYAKYLDKAARGSK